ncbi:MAG: hypothetical protein AAB532_00130, partial [Patescibacteria group bacterium]
MLRKITLIISILLTIFFILTSNPNKAIAACPSRPAVPLETEVEGGRVTITVRWDLIPSQEFDESWRIEAPDLYITIFSPDGQRVSTTGIKFPSSQESRFIQTSGFSPEKTYRIHLTNADELDANPPVKGVCTYEVDDPAPTFSVTTSELPPLKVGDDCEFSRLKCATGTYCAYKNLDTTQHRTCLKPPTSGEVCLPEAQGSVYTGQQCVNSSCQKKDDKFVCTENVVIKTPCGTKQNGTEEEFINNGQCEEVLSG